jgi:hypothetical protein
MNTIFKIFFFNSLSLTKNLFITKCLLLIHIEGLFVCFSFCFNEDLILSNSFNSKSSASSVIRKLEHWKWILFFVKVVAIRTSYTPKEEGRTLTSIDFSLLPLKCSYSLNNLFSWSLWPGNIDIFSDTTCAELIGILCHPVIECATKRICRTLSPDTIYRHAWIGFWWFPGIQFHFSTTGLVFWITSRSYSNIIKDILLTNRDKHCTEAILWTTCHENHIKFQTDFDLTFW